MDIKRENQGLRALSFGSIALGLIGIAFYWWLPLGMVMGLSGLALGVVDWESARRRSADKRLSVVGLVFSAIAVTLALVIAGLGMQTITFGR